MYGCIYDVFWVQTSSEVNLFMLYKSLKIHKNTPKIKGNLPKSKTMKFFMAIPVNECIYVLCMLVYIHVCVCEHMYVYMYVCMCIRLCICMYCVYVYVCVSLSIHNQIIIRLQ